MDNRMDNKTDAELLRQAFIDAMLIEVEETIKDIPAVRPSRRHRRRVRRILRGDYEPIRPMSLRQKIAVALVAALVAVLCGCTAYVNREAISGFVKDIFDNGIHLYIDMDTLDSDVPREIEEEYTLSYVPEGYELVESESDFADVKYEYLDGEGNYILFNQGLINDSPHGIDTEHTMHSTMEIMGYNIFYAVNDKADYGLCYWNDGKYMCELHFSKRLSMEDIEKIIAGIYN